MTVLPQIASSIPPPSMTVVKPLRWSATPANFVGLKYCVRLLSGAEPGRSCASSRKFRPSVGRVSTCDGSTTDESSAFATEIEVAVAGARRGFVHEGRLRPALVDV